MNTRNRTNVATAMGLGAVLAATAVWSQTTRPAFHRVGPPTNGAAVNQRASGDPIDLGVDDSPFTIPAVVLPERLLTSKPLAGEFDLLTRRSIFRKGSQSIARADSTSSAPPPSTEPAAGPSFIFNGVAAANDKLVAFFEDGNSHAVVLLRDGDALAQGKVQHITLGGLDYVAKGATTHLLIGQDLNGDDQGSSLASQPTGALSGDSPDPAGESMLDRLRRRRLKELSH